MCDIVSLAGTIAEQITMPVAVAHVMSSHVVFAAPDHTVAHVRELMAEKHIHALPVVAQNRQMRGIITTADLARSLDDITPVSHVMSAVVVTIKAAERASEAARLMRKHHVHHLIVTDKKTVVGIVSTFDLLRLVEEKTQ